MTNKELSMMSINEQMSWMETKLKRLSESLRVIEILISDEEKGDLGDVGSLPIYAHVIKEAREYFMIFSEQLESMGWIGLLDKGTQWYEDVVSIAVCFNKEQNIYRKVIHEECNRAINIWNDMIFMLMN